MNTDALEWIEQFLNKLRNERHYSKHTLDSYCRDLNKVVSFCAASDITDWRALNEQNLRAYVALRHRKGAGASTIQRELSACRSFFSFLLIEHVVTHNPAKGVRAPKAARKLPATLDVDQSARLLEIKANDTLALRDKAILELFYSSGLRLSELVGLDLKDIDLNDCMVEVIGKGNKVRRIPIGRHAIDALRTWLKQRNQLKVDDTHALFISQRGTRLSGRSIQKRIKEWAIKQGIDLNVHPHLLRHSFASHMLESSGDLRAVQELLGHADISTTQIYTHLDFQHLATVYDKAHPRARKKKTSQPS